MTRDCLRVDLSFADIVTRQIARGGTQSGMISFSFLNNYTKVEYFSFSYLYKTAVTKDEQALDLWTFSTNYYFSDLSKEKTLSINKNQKQSKLDILSNSTTFLIKNVLNNAIIKNRIYNKIRINFCMKS